MISKLKRRESLSLKLRADEFEEHSTAFESFGSLRRAAFIGDRRSRGVQKASVRKRSKAPGSVQRRSTTPGLARFLMLWLCMG